jgi:hypothetical protein
VEFCHFPVNATFFTLNATLFSGNSWQVVANLGTGPVHYPVLNILLSNYKLQKQRLIHYDHSAVLLMLTINDKQKLYHKIMAYSF